MEGHCLRFPRPDSRVRRDGEFWLPSSVSKNCPCLAGNGALRAPGRTQEYVVGRPLSGAKSTAARAGSSARFRMVGSAEARCRLRRVGIGTDVEADRSQLGGEPLRGSADAFERGVERVGRAAVGLDVLDGGFGAGDAELRAEQVGDGLGFGLARGEVGAGGAIGGEVQQHVRRFVGERGELDVRGLAGAAGDAAAVGVAEQAACERLVLELDVVADEEGFERLEVAVGAGVGGCRRDCRCVGAGDRVHLGDVEDVGDAVAEAGCGVGRRMSSASRCFVKSIGA